MNNVSYNVTLASSLTLWFLILITENLAAGKSTSQSSTYISSLYGSGTSDKAVDGNFDTNFRDGHCSHTMEDNPSWWRVDLGSDHMPVFEVRIVNRLWRTVLPELQNMDYMITLGKHFTVICLAKIE